MKPDILVVDDERDFLRLLKRSLEPDLNCRVETADSAETALVRLAEKSYNLMLVDIKMPGMDGLALLEILKRDFPEITVVMMTAFGKIDVAVDAIRKGAYDFITKPFDHDSLVLTLQKALERHTLITENTRLREVVHREHTFQKLVGKSPAMKKVFETIQTVADNDLTVLITGESGTGKDLAAQAVHALSTRKNGPFIAVNCPTIPEQILESELFGYKKGAFTHASQNKAGLFLKAERGTIFLDEIGDISLSAQTKMLRVLQEKEVKPLGDTRSVKVDTRIIASTNRDLQGKIRRNEFREDVFYRLNVLPIKLPPLRKHREDIPLIADHLIRKHCENLNRPMKSLSPELLDILAHRPWPGNVREMENLLLQGILYSKSREIRPADIDHLSSEKPVCLVDESVQKLPYKQAKEETLNRFNHKYIESLLEKTTGNVTKAAGICGLERQALQQIIRRYGINMKPFREK